MINILIKAMLVGIGIAIISGPMGSLIVWQRMAYFGDTLAHATLLGASIAAMLNINIYYGLIFTCVLIAIILKLTSKNFTNDTTLSILSHSILAIGLISATLIKDTRIDLLGYLCGDILSITNNDLLWILGMDIIVFSILILCWNKFVFLTINRELAMVEGINVNKLQWILIILISLIFAISIRLVGILLINSLLIIPCSIAKLWAKSPTQMAILGSIYGCLSIILGILASIYLDLPTGAAIVVTAALIFLINYLIKNLY